MESQAHLRWQEMAVANAGIIEELAEICYRHGDIHDRFIGI